MLLFSVLPFVPCNLVHGSLFALTTSPLLQWSVYMGVSSPDWAYQGQEPCFIHCCVPGTWANAWHAVGWTEKQSELLTPPHVPWNQTVPLVARHRSTSWLLLALEPFDLYRCSIFWQCDPPPAFPSIWKCSFLSSADRTVGFSSFSILCYSFISFFLASVYLGSGDMASFLMTEARQHNTEIRMAVSKVADKMDHLMTKVMESSHFESRDIKWIPWWSSS